MTRLHHARPPRQHRAKQYRINPPPNSELLMAALAELLMEGTLSKSGDAYAFGCLLWSMLTGTAPWPNVSRMQVSSSGFTMYRLPCICTGAFKSGLQSSVSSKSRPAAKTRNPQISGSSLWQMHQSGASSCHVSAAWAHAASKVNHGQCQHANPARPWLVGSPHLSPTSEQLLLPASSRHARSSSSQLCANPVGRLRPLAVLLCFGDAMAGCGAGHDEGDLTWGEPAAA